MRRLTDRADSQLETGNGRVLTAEKFSLTCDSANMTVAERFMIYNSLPSPPSTLIPRPPFLSSTTLSLRYHPSAKTKSSFVVRLIVRCCVTFTRGE
jgi:hypothetical protein